MFRFADGIARLRCTLGLIALACLIACNREAPSPSLSIADQTYSVRGVIVSLPVDGDARTALRIQHEEIPSFVGKDGTVIGMSEMTMPFSAIAPGVSLAGLSVGQPVEFTFEVRWKSEPRSLVTRMTPLPPDAALNLKSRAPADSK